MKNSTYFMCLVVTLSVVRSQACPPLYKIVLVKEDSLKSMQLFIIKSIAGLTSAERDLVEKCYKKISCVKKEPVFYSLNEDRNLLLHSYLLWPDVSGIHFKSQKDSPDRFQIIVAVGRYQNNIAESHSNLTIAVETYKKKRIKL